MIQIVNNNVQRGFSKAAKGYDRLTGLHRGIADGLLARLAQGSAPSAILDVGCGTGYLTGKIKGMFQQSRVVGLDFAAGMLDVARLGPEGIDWVLADSHQLPFADGGFDTVVSNLAYQWAADLQRAFSEARRVLADNGALACTLFGHNTCGELFQSLAEAKKTILPFKRLPNLSQIRKALLTGGFDKAEALSEEVRMEFKDMHELIVWLKTIGANNLSADVFLGPEALLSAASIYRRKFPYRKGIGVTFEVIRAYAGK